MIQFIFKLILSIIIAPTIALAVIVAILLWSMKPINFIDKLIDSIWDTNFNK